MQKLLASLLARLVAVIKSEPAFMAAIGQAVVAFIVARGYHLTPGQTGAVESAVAAVGAVIVAASTRPFRVQALGGLVTVAGTLVTAFAAHPSSGWVSVVNAGLAAVMLIVNAQRVTPVVTLRAQRKRPPAPAPAPGPAPGAH